MPEGGRGEPRPVSSKPTRIATSCGAPNAGYERSSLAPTAPGAPCPPAEAAVLCCGGPEWNGRETPTVEIACLKMSCSWLLDSSTTEYLSKLLILPESFTPLIR